MALGAVLLALVGALALWLVVDAGRERHRLRARLTRDRPAPVSPPRPTPEGVTG